MAPVMKLSLLFVTAAILNMAWAMVDMEAMQQHGEMMMKMGSECAKEVKATPQDVSYIMEKRRVPDTRTGQCLVSCMLDKAGLLVDNSIDVDKAKGIVQKMMGGGDCPISDLIGDIVRHCNKRTGLTKDKCDAAKVGGACMEETVKSLREVVQKM